MTERRQYLIAISACIFISLFLLISLFIRPPRPGPIPAPDQHTLDSLAITKPVFDSTTHALAERETIYVARVDTVRVRIHALDTAARRLQTLADSLAGVAQAAHDSGSWRAAYDARTEEADTLRRAIAQRDTAFDFEHRARLDADQRADILTHRLTVSEDLNTRLADDVRRAAECRWLWFKCPSRMRVAVVAGAVGATVGAVALSHVR
jgi:hypothetical protein